MQKRSVQILLIVSLAFNLAFIGFGTLRYFKVQRFSDPRVRFRHAPQVIKEHFREHREIIDPIRDEIDIIRGQFIAELKKPDFDEDRLQEKLDQYLSKQAELERIMGNNFIEIRKNLTAEQVEEFFSRFPNMKPPHPEREKFPQSFRQKHEND
jgi:hypothetical protein